jgi:hypothetical protein
MLLAFVALVSSSPAEARCLGGHGGHRCEGALSNQVQACIHEYSKRMPHDRAYQICIRGQRSHAAHHNFGGNRYHGQGYNKAHSKSEYFEYYHKRTVRKKVTNWHVQCVNGVCTCKYGCDEDED